MLVARLYDRLLGRCATSAPTASAVAADKVQAHLFAGFLGGLAHHGLAHLAGQGAENLANRIGIAGALFTLIEADKAGLSYDVVDDITGKRLGEVFRTRIFEPLGITDMTFELNDRLRARLAGMHMRNADGSLTATDFELPDRPEIHMGGHGLYGTVGDYMRYCWPSLKGVEDLAGVNRSDLTSLYSEGFSNTVIYIQSLGDRMHYQNHMLPFAAAVSKSPDARRFLLHSDFAGTLGHVTNPRDCADWVAAVCKAKTKEPTEILTTLTSLRSARSGSSLLGPLLRRKTVAKKPARRPTADTLPTTPPRAVMAAADHRPPMPEPVPRATTGERPARSFDSADLAIAARLRAWQTAQARKETDA